MSFPCTGCGQCCMRVGSVVEGVKKLIAEGLQVGPEFQEVAAFPFKFDQSGRCENLKDDRTCAVYDNRPDICSIEKTWQKHKAGTVSKELYYANTIKVCNKLIEESGELKYLING